MAMEFVGDINEVGDKIGDDLASAAITAGSMVRSSAGAVSAACAAVSGQVVPCTGFAPYAAASGEPVLIIRDGKITGASGLTAGQPVYLGETAGTVQGSIPVGAGKVVHIVGIAISTTEFLLNLSNSYTTL